VTHRYAQTTTQANVIHWTRRSMIRGRGRVAMAIGSTKLTMMIDSTISFAKGTPRLHAARAAGFVSTFPQTPATAGRRSAMA
jgi:hypothetical protein